MMPETSLSEPHTLATVPRPFACAVRFAAHPAKVPFREWRDVVLPCYRVLRLTQAYRAARQALTATRWLCRRGSG